MSKPILDFDYEFMSYDEAERKLYDCFQEGHISKEELMEYFEDKNNFKKF